MNDDGATAQDCGFILPTSYVVAPKKTLWPAVGRLVAVFWDAGWDVGTVTRVYAATTTTTRNKRDYELAVVARPPSSSSSSRKNGKKAWLEYSDWFVDWDAYVEPAPSDRTRYEPGSWCVLTMCAGVPPPLPPPPPKPPLQTAVRRHFGGHGWYDGRIDEVRDVNPAVEWAIDGPWMAHVRWSDGERVWYDALAVKHMMACAQGLPPQTPTLPPQTPAPPTPHQPPTIVAAGAGGTSRAARRIALPPPPAPTIVDAAQAAEAPPPPGDALPGVPADILALAPMMEESIRAQLRELRANCLTRVLQEPEFML